MIMLIHPYQATHEHARLARAIAARRGCRCLYPDSGADYSVGNDSAVIGRALVLATMAPMGADDDGCVQSATTFEAWGATLDGETWRVHLRISSATPRP